MGSVVLPNCLSASKDNITTGSKHPWRVDHSPVVHSPCARTVTERDVNPSRDGGLIQLGRWGGKGSVWIEFEGAL